MSTDADARPWLRPARPDEQDVIADVINDGAAAYRGVIPADCWHEPYMPRDALAAEIADGVAFTVAGTNGVPDAVMGMQDRGEVVLVRHAYVRTAARRRGLGRTLLAATTAGVRRPVLVGTWAAARWAVAFYRAHGFTLVDDAQKDTLLRRFWRVPDRQIAASVVLARPAPPA